MSQITPRKRLALIDERKSVSNSEKPRCWDRSLGPVPLHPSMTFRELHFFVIVVPVAIPWPIATKGWLGPVLGGNWVHRVLGRFMMPQARWLLARLDVRWASNEVVAAATLSHRFSQLP